MQSASQVFVVSLLAAAVAAQGGMDADASSGLVVHEWGFVWEAAPGMDEPTALDMVGELPAFVHTFFEQSDGDVQVSDRLLASLEVGSFGYRQARQTRPARTGTRSDPFVFFYTDRPQRVDVRVGFAIGRPVAWYPNVVEISPIALEWNDVKITPRRPKGRRMKSLRTAATDGPWRGLAEARHVPAAYVTHGAHTERFLFYESEIEFPACLLFESSEERETLTNTRRFPLRDVHIIGPPGDDRITFISRIEPGETIELAGNDRVHTAGRATLAEHLALYMTAAGLTSEEARHAAQTMLARSFTEAPGRKAVYRMPDAIYDAIYPLQITPEPDAIVRVGMVLAADIEGRTLARYCDLVAGGDETARTRALDSLRDAGRRALPFVTAEIERRGGPRALRALQWELENYTTSVGGIEDSATILTRERPADEIGRRKPSPLRR